MKREIKFRAKAINDDFFKGEWVYGYYTKELWSGNLLDVITDGANDIPIQIETLGQFTGLCDKDGKEIYEGDILLMGEDDGCMIYNEVGIKDGCFGYIGEVNGELIPFCHFNVKEEIAGNIYDNSNLI
jgi:hypothetical protein